MTIRPLRYGIAAACLLQACAAPPARVAALQVRPALQVTHASPRSTPSKGGWSRRAR